VRLLINSTFPMLLVKLASNALIMSTKTQMLIPNAFEEHAQPDINWKQTLVALHVKTTTKSI
jgi:hypothetical protein